MAFTKKITNKQGVVPNPRKHHHVQGLTCDCRQCGEEFTQYHNNHTFCSERCAWDYRGVPWTEVPCTDCGVSVEIPKSSRGGVCTRCSKKRINPERTDV